MFGPGATSSTRPTVHSDKPMHQPELMPHARPRHVRFTQRFAPAAVALALAGCGATGGGSQTSSERCDGLDSRAWVENGAGPVRQRLAEEIVRCRYLGGKSKTEVAQLL